MGMFEDFLIQAGVYLIVMIIGITIVALFFKGIFGAYIKVRTSFGKLVLIKLKAINRDHFTWGEVDSDGFLKYGKKYLEKRIKIHDSSDFYQLLGVRCIDIDEQTNSIITGYGEKIDGFDAQKYENLYIRALYKPNIQETHDVVVIGILSLIVVLIIVGLFLIYKNSVAIQGLQLTLGSLKSQVTTNVISGGSAI